MAKLLNWRDLERKIREKRLFLFSATDVCRLFGSSKVAAIFLLHRYAKQGFIIRLKRNLYVLPDFLPSELLIANQMVCPSYVSLEFALSYHQIIPETVYEMTSVTTKSTRRFEALKKFFSYRNIKKEAFTGYITVKENGFSVLIAEQEKAFVDFCYFKILNRLPMDFRFSKEKLDWKKVRRYAKLYRNQKLIDWMEEKKQ